LLASNLAANLRIPTLFIVTKPNILLVMSTNEEAYDFIQNPPETSPEISKIDPDGRLPTHPVQKDQHEPQTATDNLAVVMEDEEVVDDSKPAIEQEVAVLKPPIVRRMISTDMSIHRLDADAMDNLQEGDDRSKGGEHVIASSISVSTNQMVSQSITARPFKSKRHLPYIPAAQTRERDDNRIQLGICAMDKKARSKPMAEILSRLDETLFQVVFFGDHVILNEPIEDWPICNVVIAFFSKGYPLPKAKEYVALRKPCILNDLDMQVLLQDRRRVYDLLQASGIDVPRHVYLSRDGYVSSTGMGDGNGLQDKEVQEFDDHIEVNGVTIHKPFVEKPVDAEDHNIAIYYPTSAGGGCKKLFRKIGNRSSEFYPVGSA
jgi:hypothetical protein